MELRQFTYVDMVAKCGSFTKAAAKLFISQPALSNYINKVEDLRIYLVQIAECTNAVELARVIVKMGEREPKITSEEMVKERFISLFFPLTPLFVSVKTVSNIRARINNAWARRPRKRL